MNDTITQAMIDAAKTGYLAAQIKLDETRTTLAGIKTALANLWVYFNNLDNCKWKNGGRYKGAPRSPSHNPTSGANSDCGWKKTSFFTYQARIPLLTADIISQQKIRDDKKKLWEDMLSSAETEALLDPDYLAEQQRLAAEQERLEAEKKAEQEELDAKLGLAKTQTKWIIIGVVVLIIVLVVGFLLLKKYKVI